MTELRPHSVSDFTTFQLYASEQRTREPRTIEYCGIRLTEEAGEVAGVVRRAYNRMATYGIRGSSLTTAERVKLLDEAGDVLHSLAKLLDVAGISLADVASSSLDKQATHR